MSIVVVLLVLLVSVVLLVVVVGFGSVSFAASFQDCLAGVTPPKIVYTFIQRRFSSKEQW